MLRLFLALALGLPASAQMLSGIVGDTHQSGGGGATPLIVSGTNLQFSPGATSSGVDTSTATSLWAWSTCYTNGGATNESAVTDTPPGGVANTWTLVTGSRRAAANTVGAWYRAYSNGAGTGALVVGAGHTFTASSCASGFGGRIFVFADKGTKTYPTDPLDQNGICADHSADTIALTITPSVANAMLMTGVTNYAQIAPSIDQSFTILDHTESASFSDGGDAYLTYNSTSPITVTWTISGAGAAAGSACIVAAKPQ